MMGKWLAWWILVCLVATLPASAHDRMTSDPNDSGGRLDIESVHFQHDMPAQLARSQKIVRITIRFFGAHGLPDEYGFIKVEMRPTDRKYGRRRILLERNPDGSLFAAVDTGAGDFLGFGRAWAEDERTFVIEIVKSQLPPGADQIEWRLLTSYNERGLCLYEAGSPYVDECLDILPGPNLDDDTWIHHDLRKV